MVKRQSKAYHFLNALPSFELMLFVVLLYLYVIPVPHFSTVFLSFFLENLFSGFISDTLDTLKNTIIWDYFHSQTHTPNGNVGPSGI